MRNSWRRSESGSTSLFLRDHSMFHPAQKLSRSTNDVVMREALQTRRMAPCHAMGLREGVLRDAPAPQASPARGAPQHRLTKTSGEYVYPYLEGDERAAAVVGRGTSFAAPQNAACCTSDPPTVFCVPRCARNLSPAGPVPLYWSAGGQTRAHPGGSALIFYRRIVGR